MLDLGAGREFFFDLFFFSPHPCAAPTTSFPFLLAAPDPLSMPTCLLSGVVALLKA